MRPDTSSCRCASSFRGSLHHDPVPTPTRLRLERLAVRDLRCHAGLSVEFAPGLNCIVGDNGSGKTTLLEAVSLLVSGRSFRQARDPLLVRAGATRMELAGDWLRFGPVRTRASGRRGSLKLTMQGREVSRQALADILPVLIEAPQGERIAEGPARSRRRWLDQLVLIARPHLRADYHRYLRAVMQRARLLRRGASGSEVEAWEHMIVRHGMPIARARAEVIREFNALLEDEREFVEQTIRLVLAAEYEPESWLASLSQRRAEHARRGLRTGPHCDGLSILWGSREIRSSGSRGQQRLAAVALKMAECAWWCRHRRLSPVLLLDDCFDALDSVRRSRLMARLKQAPMQVLMTAPALPAEARDAGMACIRLRPDGIHGLEEAA